MSSCNLYFIQNASGVPYGGLVRRLWPGATYPGECVGYWDLTPSTPPSCADPALGMTAVTGHTEIVSDGVYTASVFLTLTAATGSSHFLNMTFAQDIVVADSELLNPTVGLSSFF